MTDVERRLAGDLESLEERLADEEFMSDLYRALTNTAWRKGDARVSLSWSKAEALVNDLRGRVDRPTLELAQTGGEGEVAGVVADELGRLGWQPEPIGVGHDASHLTRDEEAPPPKRRAAEEAPVDDPKRWERLAHEEAERNR